MSYVELTQHARDIKDAAVDLEGREQRLYNAGLSGGDTPAPPVDYDKIEQKYAFIEPLFEPYSRLPDPATYSPMSDELRLAMESLSTGQYPTDPINKRPIRSNSKLSSIDTAGDYLASWSGSAAMSFKENFIDTFGSVTANQFVLLSTMKGALDAHRQLWQAARKDIDKIAHTTLDALDNAGNTGKNEWSFVFSVISAVVALGSIPLTGGASTGLAAVGAGAAAGSAGGAGLTASGDSAEDITDSMKQAVGKLTRHIQEKETVISEALQKTTGTVSGKRELFIAARPALANLLGGELTADGGMGTSS